MKHRCSWLAVALSGLLVGGCGGGGESEEISEGTPSEFGDEAVASSSPEPATPAGDAPAPPAVTAETLAGTTPPDASPTTPPATEATAAAGAPASDAPNADNSGTLAMLQAANSSAPSPDQAGTSSGQPGPQGYPMPGQSGGQGPGGPGGYPGPGSSGGPMASQGPGGPGGYPMPGQAGGQGGAAAYNQNAPGRNAGSGGMRPDSTQGGGGPGGPGGYPMPGANGMAANMPGAPGMAPGGPGGRGDSAQSGMMPGYGGGSGGKPDYSQPSKTVESFLNAIRNRDLALLAEATSARASSDSGNAKMQEFFKTVIERSLEPNQLGELATEMSNYKVVNVLPAKSTGRREVLIGKEGKDERDRKVYFSRTVTVRKEKTLWKVLDVTKASKNPMNARN